MASAHAAALRVVLFYQHTDKRELGRVSMRDVDINKVMEKANKFLNCDPITQLTSLLIQVLLLALMNYSPSARKIEANKLSICITLCLKSKNTRKHTIAGQFTIDN